jgi:hypothetical protein
MIGLGTLKAVLARLLNGPSATAVPTTGDAAISVRGDVGESHLRGDRDPYAARTRATIARLNDEGAA